MGKLLSTHIKLLIIIKHVESLKGWTLSYSIKVTAKFKGQYIEVIPEGDIRLEFVKTGICYSWKKAKTFVNNVIFGKMWMNMVGEIDLINHSTNDVCHVKFFPYSTFSRVPPNKVSGIIKDSNNLAKYVLDGNWTSSIKCASVLNQTAVKSFDDFEKIVKGNFEILWERALPP